MKRELIGLIEGILFSYGDPLSIEDLSKIVGFELKDVNDALNELESDMLNENRGIFLVKFDNKVQLGAKPYIYQYMKKIFVGENKKRLSNAAMETLAIIAYKQPITKIEIENIRGVKCENILNRLIESDLIYISGQLNRIGHPNIYSTTAEFLKQFGLKSIKELPNLEMYNEENEN